MRQQVIELGKMGPMPAEDVAVRDNLEDLLRRYGDLIDSIERPVTDDEARALVRIFGPDECFEVYGR
jgi:hypothetical protein